jgi:hypothetical protein
LVAACAKANKVAQLNPVAGMAMAGTAANAERKKVRRLMETLKFFSRWAGVRLYA